MRDTAHSLLGSSYTCNPALVLALLCQGGSGAGLFFFSSQAYLRLFRSMREQSSLDLVAFCLAVLEVLECSLSFLVWILMRK